VIAAIWMLLTIFCLIATMIIGCVGWKFDKGGGWFVTFEVFLIVTVALLSIPAVLIFFFIGNLLSGGVGWKILRISIAV
jgi:hypothetical protein